MQLPDKSGKTVFCCVFASYLPLQKILSLMRMFLCLNNCIKLLQLILITVFLWEFSSPCVMFDGMLNAQLVSIKIYINVF